MYCENCRVRIPFDKAPELTECAMCGRPLKADVRDVFVCGKFGIIEEKRDSQISMALEIEKFLTRKKGIFLIEGGTGIGKSFAYLIPALLSEGKRVVISTAKKTLQDQLATKDVPLLVKKMGLDKLKYGLYKGKSNYACWKLSREVPNQDRKRFDRFIEQARGNGKPADLANWKGVVPYWWSKISIDNCVLGKNCPHIATCRPHPQADNLIITNHHLTAIDMKTVPGMLFGSYNLLVLDEAHQVKDAFRSVNSRAVTHRGLEIIKNMVANDEHLRSMVDDSGIISARALTEELGELTSLFKGVHETAYSKADTGGSFNSDEIAKPLVTMSSHAETVASHVFLVMGALNRAYTSTIDGGRDSHGDASADELMALMGRTNRLHKKLTDISAFVVDLARTTQDVGATNIGNPNVLTTCDPKGIYLRPVETGPIIGPKLDMIDHTMALSATLAMGHDFSYVKRDLGLLEIKNADLVTEQIYASPFNLDKQAALYAPRHLPLPAHAGMPEERHEWLKAVTTEIAQLISATRGDCFVLFSAKRDMRDILDELGSFFWDDAKLHLVLHEGEATSTLDEYKRVPSAVLFGQKSFWEGVDIPGDKLKLIIIPKLPFPSPVDPLIKALNAKRGANAFFEVSIPPMIFDMKQGVGRLIRTQSDKGCVAILDVRIWTGTGDRLKHRRKMELIEADPNRTRMGYGKTLLDALGFTKITDDFTIFQKFVKKFFNDV